MAWVLTDRIPLCYKSNSVRATKGTRISVVRSPILPAAVNGDRAVSTDNECKDVCWATAAGQRERWAKAVLTAAALGSVIRG